MNWTKLKEVRELLGYSQGDIADKTGLKQKDISLLEAGKKKFIPLEYILFLYNQNIDINSIYAESLPITVRNDNNTPNAIDENTGVEHIKNTQILSPNNTKKLSPTLSPTQTLGLPKVITVAENDREVISLVSAKSAAGYLNGYADPEYIEQLPTLRIPNIGHGTFRAFEIKGQSMSPTLHNSSLGIGQWIESFEDIRDRRIYTIVTRSEGIVTKRVLNRIDDTGRLILISDNQNKREYPNILLDPEEVLEMWYLRANLAFEFPEPDAIYNRVNDLEAKVTVIMDQLQHRLK
ncbi:hypothetical protein [Sphingobacterium cellulitidis]|uniref:hypothetical protein n=1 Tax=Sphingobacterium cellulitidis TaxID=1768011 RepID=UPI003C7A6623